MDSESVKTTGETVLVIPESEFDLGQELQEVEDETSKSDNHVEENVEDKEEEEEAYEYTESQVKEVRKAFKLYDTMKSDTIPLRYLGSVLRALGQNPTERQLREHAKWLRLDPQEGFVRFKEFLIILGRTLKDPITTERVIKGFRCLDEDSNGIVLCDRLRAALTTTAERLYPKEISLFLKHADPKKKGIVKYEYFVTKMNKIAAAGGIKKKKKKRKGKKKGKKTKKVKNREGGDNSSSCSY